MTNPVPLLLRCPECSARHVDASEWATRPHHTHACQECGHVWRPAVVNTVGVQFLPGFKDGDGKPRVEERIVASQKRQRLVDGTSVLPDPREALIPQRVLSAARLCAIVSCSSAAQVTAPGHEERPGPYDRCLLRSSYVQLRSRPLCSVPGCGAEAIITDPCYCISHLSPSDKIVREVGITVYHDGSLHLDWSHGPWVPGKTYVFRGGEES